MTKIIDNYSQIDTDIGLNEDIHKNSNFWKNNIINKNKFNGFNNNFIVNNIDTQILNIFKNYVENFNKLYKLSNNPTRLIEIINKNEKLYCLKETYLSNILVPYVAISHVWGDNNINKDKLNFIIKMLKNTDIKHIWMDNYCILQDSKEDKESEIPKMREYYSKSLFTMIILSGVFWNNISISDNIIINNIIESKKPFYLMDINRDLGLSDLEEKNICYLFSCIIMEPWMKRIWTLQEILLSNNALIVSKKVCFNFFECISLIAEMITRKPNLKHNVINFILNNNSDHKYDKKYILGQYENTWLAITEIIRYRNENGKKTCLSDILTLSNIRDSTLIIDRAYGILGLLPHKPAEPIDYSKGIDYAWEVVYKTAILCEDVSWMSSFELGNIESKLSNYWKPYNPENILASTQGYLKLNCKVDFGNYLCLENVNIQYIENEEIKLIKPYNGSSIFCNYLVTIGIIRMILGYENAMNATGGNSYNILAQMGISPEDKGHLIQIGSKLYMAQKIMKPEITLSRGNLEYYGELAQLFKWKFDKLRLINYLNNKEKKWILILKDFDDNKNNKSKIVINIATGTTFVSELVWVVEEMGNNIYRRIGMSSWTMDKLCDKNKLNIYLI